MKHLSSNLPRAVATALLLGATTLAAVAQPAQHGDGPDFASDRMHRHEMLGGGPEAMARRSERMLDEVKATPEQRAQIRKLMQAAHKDLQGQREARQALRKQQDALFAQPNVDARAVENLRQQGLAHMDAASKRMTQLRLDMSQVLSPEQRKMLQDRRNQRMDMRERHQRERRALDAAPR